MLRIIVVAKRKDETISYDLEIPAEIEIRELAPTIATALGWSHQDADASAKYAVYVPSQNRHLSPDETLATAGVWDGAQLEFQLQAKAIDTTIIVPWSPIKLITSAGTEYRITTSPSILGRRTTSNAEMTNLVDFGHESNGKSVSRQHAKIEWRNNSWNITPLHGTHNQTLVNGERVTPGLDKEFFPGDTIILGDVQLVVEIIEETETIV